MVQGNHQPNFGGTFGLKLWDSKAWLVRMEMLIQDYGGAGLRSAGNEPPSWEGRVGSEECCPGAGWPGSSGNLQLGVLGPSLVGSWRAGLDS